MALSRIEGQDHLYVGGLWALRRTDSLQQRGITHVLSLFDPSGLKNFKDEPWAVYGKAFRHLLIDIDDVDESDLLIELPRAVRFIDDGLRGGEKAAAVFVHCAAGKSRSVAVVVAYLLWRFPHRFDPDAVPDAVPSDGSVSQDNHHAAPRKHRKETAQRAVAAALALVRQSRPLAEPNCGFMQQLALWWEMGCPDDVETHPVYQRWAYRREVEESVAAGQAPSRLRFEDEQQPGGPTSSSSPSSSSSSTAAAAPATHPCPELKLRCKKCRLMLAAGPFIQTHAPAKPMKEPCPHHFVEPLSWMRGELERGRLDGRLVCPNERCGTVVGRYDWKGLRCACGGWVTPGLSLQRGRVDEERVSRSLTGEASMVRMGIRMPPGRGGAGSL
ncbi:hypothetical protein CP532_1215 [Ophiocordyceps camponoti-leonardi (nom. inval.)]|nr:hypothetical protein CP532_1215 [Ophiocordyceps camponoti-leonardi (nom. inval.)]